MTNKINKDVINFINELTDYLSDECSSNWTIYGMVDDPKGVKQDSLCNLFDYEWVDQRGHDDMYYGDMYFPLGERYLQIKYYC